MDDYLLMRGPLDYEEDFEQEGALDANITERLEAAAALYEMFGE